MRRSNLKSLSFDDLIGLRNSVVTLIRKKAKATRAELESKLAALGEFSPGESRGRRRPESALKGRRVPAKYRNPKKRSETWAGRGAMPLWLRAQIKAGKKLESFAIKRGRPKKAA
jgi:DNA-binding protein H-NS